MTISEIAREAGVSVSTVSRVLNHPEQVNPKTRKKVAYVLAQYNFAPRHIESALEPREKKTIIIFSNNIRHQHFASTAYVLDEMFFELGYRVIVSSTGDIFEKRVQQFSALSNLSVDGIILLGSTFADDRIGIALNNCFPNVPIVISNGVLQNADASSVLIDHDHGMDLLISHLRERGHERIALAHAYLTYNCKRKIHAFQKAKEKYALPTYDAYIFGMPESSVEAGTAFADRFIEAHCGCTAVVFTDDLPAVAAINQFRNCKIKIPEEIAVVGYDNSTYAECAFPALTTVDTKSKTLASVIGYTLLDRMAGKDVGDNIILKPELVVRKST